MVTGLGGRVRQPAVAGLGIGLELAVMFAPVAATIAASCVASDYWQRRVVSRAYGAEAWAAGLRITPGTLTDGRPVDRADLWALSAGILAGTVPVLVASVLAADWLLRRWSGWGTSTTARSWADTGILPPLGADGLLTLP